MATLNMVFKKVFEESLASKGYVKVKGRQLYFARIIGGEIVQVITTRNYWCGEKEYKEFEILGGMASVYQKTVDLTLSPSANINWLECLATYYYKMNREKNYDREYRNNLMGFRYKKDDEESLYQAMRQALKETEKHMLEVFDSANDLQEYMKYLNLFRRSRLIIEKYDEENGVFEESMENEGFLYIKTGNHTDLKEEYANELARIINTIEFKSASEKMEKIAFEKKLNEECRIRQLQRRDYIYTHEEVHKKVLELLDERKKNNLEKLSSCGLNIV